MQNLRQLRRTDMSPQVCAKDIEYYEKVKAYKKIIPKLLHKSTLCLPSASIETACYKSL